MTYVNPTPAELVGTFLEQLKAAVDRYRWCLACGCSQHRCDGWARSIVQRKCCPDCRHRGWPEELDVDPDPQGTLTRAIQMLLWKVGGTVDFTERDMADVDLQEFPLPEIVAADDPAYPGWHTRIRLPGWQLRRMG